jgi:hypothetical protein
MNRVPLAAPVGELALEIFVNLERAVGGARSGRAGAVFEHRAAGGVGHRGVQRQAEIVVGSEHQRRPSLDNHFAGADDAFDDREAGHGVALGEHRAPLFDHLQLVQQIHLAPGLQSRVPGPSP